MIYLFTSAVGPRVTYTGVVGDEILRHAGKTPGPRGVIPVAEIDAVVARLGLAVAHEASASKLAAPQAQSEDEEEPQPPEIPLERRLVPFLELLARAKAAGKDVTWGI